MTVTADNKHSAQCASCAFLDYPADHKGYRCFNLATCKVITSRHIVFNETPFPFVATPVQQASAMSPPIRSSAPHPATPSRADDGMPPLRRLQTTTVHPWCQVRHTPEPQRQPRLRALHRVNLMRPHVATLDNDSDYVVLINTTRHTYPMQ
jgi:hypothetical protein